MTTNACAERGLYPENASARLWEAIAFAGGLVLGLASGPRRRAAAMLCRASMTCCSAQWTMRI
jgi:hypothetical protein